MTVRRRLAAAFAAWLWMLRAAAPQEPDPPYAAQIERLAEILGSLHFLSGLCTDEPISWRAEMEDLLLAEQPDEERRDRLVDRFNLGYSALAAVYRRCTAAAAAAEANYRREGADIAAAIAEEFAPPVTGEEGPQAAPPDVSQDTVNDALMP